MANEFNRHERVGDTIQRELAILLQTRIRDPRIGMVNINAVRVTDDLRHAKIYVTFVDERAEADIKKAIEALNKASGFLRSHLHERMVMRVIPRLHFEFDESVARAARLTQLIDSVAPKTPRNPE